MAEPTQPKPTTSQPTVAKRPGFFLTTANWLLSRMPWFRDRYLNWSNGKRIAIGLPLYLIALPVIPIVIAVILYVRDPEAFKRSKAMPLLAGLIVAWFGAFGMVAMQTPVTENTNNKSVVTPSTSPKAKTVDTSDTTTGAAASASKKKVESKQTSEATLGRSFENCDAAFDAGVFNIAKSDPSYLDKLDGDNDGVACEK